MRDFKDKQLNKLLSSYQNLKLPNEMLSDVIQVIDNKTQEGEDIVKKIANAERQGVPITTMGDLKTYEAATKYPIGIDTTEDITKGTFNKDDMLFTPIDDKKNTTDILEAQNAKMPLFTPIIKEQVGNVPNAKTPINEDPLNKAIDKEVANQTKGKTADGKTDPKQPKLSKMEQLLADYDALRATDLSEARTKDDRMKTIALLGRAFENIGAGIAGTGGAQMLPVDNDFYKQLADSKQEARAIADRDSKSENLMSQIQRQRGIEELEFRKEQQDDLKKHREDLLLNQKLQLADKEEKKKILDNEKWKQQQRTRDETIFRDTIKTITIGGRGGKIVADAIRKVWSVQDALDSLEAIKRGDIVGTAEYQQMLSTLLASILASGGSGTTESAIKALTPSTVKGDINKHIQYISGNPKEYLNPKMLKNFEEMIMVEGRHWRKQINNQSSQLMTMLKPSLDRKDPITGEYLNKDFLPHLSELFENKAADLEYAQDKKKSDSIDGTRGTQKEILDANRKKYTIPVGTIKDGYQYLGGDLNDSKNWKQIR